METLISSLPVELSREEAVDLAYREDLDWIEEKLSRGLSVLIECDKQLTGYLYRALRGRLRRAGAQRVCRHISGHSQPEEGLGAGQSRMQRIIQELQAAILEANEDQLLVLPHLDVLTTTTRSGLNAETREAAALLYENPEAAFLGFKDPSFELPKVIESAFTVRRSVMGISREALLRLILQREARKFGVESFNPYRLYKYLSGLNAARCREILGQMQGRVDFDPRSPQLVDDLYRDIRQMTLVADFELPNVDLSADIGGYEQVKARLQRELLSFLERREQLDDVTEIKQLEELVPKGIIFHGPPGTGKTFFCKALATSLDATIIIVSGPELKSKWVGESEENLRKVFAQARRAAPSIIVFDELDSFASARGTYTGSGVEHSMVNQLLTEMDGFRSEEQVFVVGTTNFLESLDPALLRPGRFEMNIHVPYPNEADRESILSLYNQKFKLPLSGAQLKELARRTSGAVPGGDTSYSGDHLYALMRGLKREQLRSGGELTINERLISSTLSGQAEAHKRLTDHERRVIATHEAGHAICTYFLPECPEVEEISVARDSSAALGFVRAGRERSFVTTRADLLGQLCVLLSGRLAEQLLIGEGSTGAQDDLRRATELARLMVEELGMSEALGLRTFSGPALPDGARGRVEAEISALIDGQRERAMRLLEERRASLEALVEHLIKHERCERAELEGLIGPA